MKRYGSRRKWALAGPLLILAALLATGCATTSPYYNPNTVAATSFGMGALGTALGYAATGNPMWAAVGGLSGLAAGAMTGAAIEESRARYYEPPPPPPPSTEGPSSSGYYRPQKCRRVHTVVRENGVVVREYDREICTDAPYAYRHRYYPY
jgi:hypothetical protein